MKVQRIEHLSLRNFVLDCLKKVIMAYVSGGIVTVLVAFLAFFASNPAQDYAISVDPVLSKGPGGTYTNVTIKNTGKQTGLLLTHH